MEEEIKYMNSTPSMVFGLEKILDYLVENAEYEAKIGNIEIGFMGIHENTNKGKRQVFRIERKVK